MIDSNLGMAAKAVMEDAYKLATGTPEIDLSKVPSYKVIKTAMEGRLAKSSLQVHHTVPKWLQQRLQTLTGKTWDLDDCPSILLEQIDHTGSTKRTGPTARSFHNTLDMYLREDLVDTYGEADILEGLDQAYSEFKRVNGINIDIWGVAATWLDQRLNP